MRDRGIDADDEIEIGDRRGRLREICEAAERGDEVVLLQEGPVVRGRFMMQADPLRVPGQQRGEQGRLQGTSCAIAPPGEAIEDWEALVALAAALGVKIEYESAQAVRTDIAARFDDVKALEGIATLAFAKPVSAKHWLQASNPSERWKWDFMYQDLPPVKGELDPTALPLPPGAIALKQV